VSEIHRFLFDGVPVRGVLVRLDDAWRTILARRAGVAYPAPVQNLLGEMLAAAALLRANIKFDGALILQIAGDGPLKLAVAEVQADFGLRATASVTGVVAAQADLNALVNLHNQGKCLITLDARTRPAAQPPYQGVASLCDGQQQPFAKLSDALQHYMLQSEQLDTCLVLAADAQAAAGLLIQRLPAGALGSTAPPHDAPDDDAYGRIALLAASLQREELLRLAAPAILRRLFWAENLVHLPPTAGAATPHFSCTCSPERVRHMILAWGQEEALTLLAERANIEVGCEFCGAQYRFDAVDVAQIFQPPAWPSSSALQ
jgi:molecular chaperone Hsp33